MLSLGKHYVLLEFSASKRGKEMKMVWNLGRFISYEKMIFHLFANISASFVTNGLKFAQSSV
jgi:hypothetical protein